MSLVKRREIYRQYHKLETCVHIRGEQIMNLVNGKTDDMTHALRILYDRTGY